MIHTVTPRVVRTYHESGPFASAREGEGIRLPAKGASFVLVEGVRANSEQSHLRRCVFTFATVLTGLIVTPYVHAIVRCPRTAHRNGREKRHSRGVRRGERIPFAFERAAQGQVLQLRSVQQRDQHRKVDAPGG